LTARAAVAILCLVLEDLSGHIRDLLRCPVCGGQLRTAEACLDCTSPACGRRFPVVDGVPVLINDAKSLFCIEDFTQRRATFFDTRHRCWAARAIDRLTPSLTLNVKAKANYARLSQLLLGRSDAPKVLVLGGSAQGLGMEPLIRRNQIELVDTDVAFGPRTKIICDAHDIPFADGSFDGVVAQAVLEHVADPYRCVSEIHRVLKDDGLVYAETPFMQQMHGAPYDFTRFTIQGYRRLFAAFEEIDCGVCTGPGMALGWAYKYFMLALVKSKAARKAMEVFVRLTAWHLKYVDRILVNRPYAVYGASGYHFLGTKSNLTATDREIVERWRASQ
jgi:SAM-dependent methyltransferase/uncharacterized protein YbaR (Trm112 family)